MDAVQAAIAAARNVADTVAPPPLAPMTPPAPLAPMGVGRVKTLADAVETFVERPELFIKVDYYGMHIEDDGIIKEIEGEMKLDDLKFPSVCRYTRAGTHDYLRTYDGVREVKTGKSWGQALDEAKRIDQGADVYEAVEYTISLTKEVTKVGGKKEVTPPVIGQRLGHTTSRTGYDPIMKFARDMFKKHGAGATVKVRLEHVQRQKGQNKWGVISATEIE